MTSADLPDDFRAKALGLKHLTKFQLETKLKEIPQKLRDFTVENCVLTGGCFASLFHMEKINDYDLYLKDILKTGELRNLIKEYVGPEQPDEQPYSEHYVNGKIETVNAITLDNRLQYIVMKDYETCKKLFDYTHCCINYDLKSDTLWMSKEQLECIKNKKLKVNNENSVKPRRLQKFLDKGWMRPGP